MNQRDLELLSSYLDGHLNPSDVTRLESRLKTDPQLASVLNDLRATRSLLRKLPQRRAPRNFTLTRKMAGQNPPLPRAYPFFRFATVFATLLFVFSFGANSLARQLATPGFGIGGGGGAAQDNTQLFSSEAAATQAPAMEAPATEAPTEPPAAMLPAPTLGATAEAGTRIETTPAQKNGDLSNATGLNPEQSRQAEQNPAPLIPSTWQIGLAALAVVGFLWMFLTHQLAARRWRKE